MSDSQLRERIRKDTAQLAFNYVGNRQRKLFELPLVENPEIISARPSDKDRALTPPGRSLRMEAGSYQPAPGGGQNHASPAHPDHNLSL